MFFHSSTPSPASSLPHTLPEQLLGKASPAAPTGQHHPALFSAPLQPLVLWQVLSLFWFCGLLAPRVPVQALCAALLFFVLDTRLRNKVTCMCALCFFVAGFITTMELLPRRPALPAWTEHHGRPVARLVEGQVVRVQSLVDGRQRIFLQNVRLVSPALPVSPNAPDTPFLSPEQESVAPAPLPGLAVWTWEMSQKYRGQSGEVQRPLPGQRVQLKAKIRTTQGYRNAWGSDFGFYWQSKEVFWRLWTRGAMGNPQFFGEAHFWAQQREKVVHTLNEALEGALENTAPFTAEGGDFIAKQALAFLPALLLGEKFALAHSTVEGMQGLSLVHSLALSGQHLALVIVWAWGLTWALSWVAPGLFAFVPRYRVLALLSLPLAALYLWLGNAPASLVRAACMLGVAFLFLWQHKVSTLRHVIFCALCLLTVYAPLAVFDMGLQLSALCVLSITLIVPFLRRWQRRVRMPLLKPSLPATLMHGKYGMRAMGRVLGQIFLISLTIQGALLPVMLLYFPPQGWFVANIFWLPILSFWVLPWGAVGLLCALGAQSALAAKVLAVAALPCQGLLWLIHYLQGAGLLEVSAVLRPHWTAVLGWIPLVLALGLLTGRVSVKDIRTSQVRLPPMVKKCFIVGACLLCLGPVLRYAQYSFNTVQLHMFDVGQGQALAIDLPGGERFLVDGGGSFSRRFDPGEDLVLPSLVYNKAPRVWAMISTHADVDHVRGLVSMAPHVRMQYFFTNGKPLGAYEQTQWEQAAQHHHLPSFTPLYAGQKIALPTHDYGQEAPLFLEVLWPPKDSAWEGNNASLVLRLVQGSGQESVGLALLCGDAELPVLKALLASGQNIKSRVLVLPHHGALDGFLPEWYDAVGAEVVLASAAQQNSFGHPHAKVREALALRQMPLYTTAQEGAIGITFAKDLYLQTVRRKNTYGHLQF